MNPRTQKVVVLVYTILFIVVAVYHLVGIFIPINDSPVWRHALFIVINLYCVYGLHHISKFFVAFFGIFTIQQSYSHGTSILQYCKEGRIDYLSIGVIVLSGLLLYLMITNKIEASRNP